MVVSALQSEPKEAIQAIVNIHTELREHRRAARIGYGKNRGLTMRIGYFVPEFPGQTHIFFWRELQSLKRRGVDLVIISTRRPNSRIVSHVWSADAIKECIYLRSVDRYLALALIEVFRNPAGWVRCLRSIRRCADKLHLFALALAAAKLSAIARRQRLSHVHVHSCADSAYVAMFSWLLARLPYSLTLHGPLNDYGQNQEMKWRHAKFAIVITKRLEREVRTTLADHLPPIVQVAPMGVDVATLKRTSSYQPWAAGNGRLRIFSCGRLHPGKGHVTLITALKELRQAGIDAEIEIAGEDAQGGTGYRKTIEALIAELRLQDVVRLRGAVSEAEVKASLERAHIFALASREEPLGVAIMEALAMEVPCVVTSTGGVPELIDDGIDGLLVPPDDPHQLAHGILSVLRKGHTAAELGQKGRRKIEQLFHSGRSADVLISALSRSQTQAPSSI